MSTGEEVFRRLQAAARSTASKTGSPAPTQEYLTRHVLESFLDRLTRSRHGDAFVIKGGILLASYGWRRSTKDVDVNAISADVTPAHLTELVRDLAAMELDDGVVFDVGSIEVAEIREEADYPGFRVRVGAGIGVWRGVAAWDVSTGDPIVPPPRMVRIERVDGDPIEVLGYAAETSIAEKGVTILERGITSTRWRDYVDIVQLDGQGINRDDLRLAAAAVAAHRGVILQPVSRVLAGYGQVAQAKWAAWRRKERLEAVADELLDDQIARVAAVLDPIFGPPSTREDL